MKNTSKQFGPLSDTENKKISKIKDLINFLLKRYKVGSLKRTLDTITDKILSSEHTYMKWKDAGCPSFEKTLEEEKRQKLVKGEPLLKRDSEYTEENLKSIHSWMESDIEYSHMDSLDKGNLMVSEKPIEPAMSKYFMGIIDGSHAESLNDIEDNVVLNSKANQDPLLESKEDRLQRQPVCYLPGGLRSGQIKAVG